MKAPALVLLLLVAALAGCVEESDGGSSPSTREDTKSFEIGPGKGLEFKLYMNRGAELDYSWDAGRPVFFDFHGDRKGDTSGAFTTHKKSTLARDSGTFTAPFDGRHGWYWENRNRAEVTITLTTKGTYDVVGITG